MDYLQQKIRSCPGQTAFLEEIGHLYSNKLWHQLGCKLIDILTIDELSRNGGLLDIYQKFVHKFQNELKPLTLVQFVIKTSDQVTDLSEKLNFIEKILSVVEKETGPLLLLKLEMCSLHILKGNLPSAADGLEDAQTLLDSSREEFPSIVPSRLFQIKMEYHKLAGTASDFFRNALLYLSYTPFETIPVAQQVEISASLGLAALAAEDQYNFGELLQLPILRSLDGTPQQWIKEMLVAFDQGKIDNFETLFAKKNAANPILSKNTAFLRQKIRIMNLMDMVFTRPSNDRNIKFHEIALICQVTVDEVELLLMKAMSLKVIKGVIDEVDQIVRVQHVQPRVLNSQQVDDLRVQLISWADKVQSSVVFLENSAPELMNA